MEEMIDSLKEQIDTLQALLQDEVNRSQKERINLSTKMTKSLQDLSTDHALKVKRLNEFNSYLTSKSKKDTCYMLNVLEEGYQRQMKRIKDEKSITEAALRNHKTTVADELAELWEEKNQQTQKDYKANLKKVAKDTKEEMLKLYEMKIKNIMEMHKKEINSLDKTIQNKEKDIIKIEDTLKEALLKLQEADMLSSDILLLKRQVHQLHVKLEHADNKSLMYEKEIDELQHALEEQRSLNARKQSIALRNKQLSSRLSDNSNSETERSSSSGSGSPNSKSLKQVRQKSYRL